jgi:hypothetical protein
MPESGRALRAARGEHGTPFRTLLPAGRGARADLYAAFEASTTAGCSDYGEGDGEQDVNHAATLTFITLLMRLRLLKRLLPPSWLILWPLATIAAAMALSGLPCARSAPLSRIASCGTSSP